MLLSLADLDGAKPGHRECHSAFSHIAAKPPTLLTPTVTWKCSAQSAKNKA